MERSKFFNDFYKKTESKNTIYLVCNKRGYSSNICPGKAKFNKDTGELSIYEKCINNNNHNKVDYKEFRIFFNSKNFKNLDMNSKHFQKLFIQCLYEDNIVNDYLECMQKFKLYFPNNTFILNEEIVRKIKFNIKGGVKAYNIEDLCKSIKIYNKDIIVDIFPVKTEYKNKNKEIEPREQNIIIISHKEMLPFLSKEKATQYGIDCTFRIIPKSLKP